MAKFRAHGLFGIVAGNADGLNGGNAGANCAHDQVDGVGERFEEP